MCARLLLGTACQQKRRESEGEVAGKREGSKELRPLAGHDALVGSDSKQVPTKFFGSHAKASMLAAQP
jgi:hypothetical protein